MVLHMPVEIPEYLKQHLQDPTSVALSTMGPRRFTVRLNLLGLGNILYVAPTDQSKLSLLRDSGASIDHAQDGTCKYVPLGLFKPEIRDDLLAKLAASDAVKLFAKDTRGRQQVLVDAVRAAGSRSIEDSDFEYCNKSALAVYRTASLHHGSVLVLDVEGLLADTKRKR